MMHRPILRQLTTFLSLVFGTLILTSPLLAQNQTQPESPDWRQSLQEQHQFSFEMGYILIFQAASNTIDDASNLLSGSYDVGLVWTPWTGGTWELGFEGGQIISHNKNEDLSANVGSNLGINDDLDNQDIVLSTLFYSHSFADDTFILTLGKFNQSDFLDANEIANDETTQFLATALVNNLTIPFPDDGLGANLWVNLSDNVYVTAGFGDGNAVSTYQPFNTFADGDFFYGAEVGYINTAQLSGNYRLTLWHAQTPTDDGSGIAISIDQHITSNLVAFARWGMGDEKITDFDQFLSLGIGIESPFGRESDLFAIGMAWADPSDPAVDQETIVEAFYRYQLNELMQITPSVQAIINPAASTESDTVYVVGLRLQTTW